jgi:HTH-type transcriptional regulator/antitoxin HigA
LFSGEWYNPYRVKLSSASKKYQKLYFNLRNVGYLNVLGALVYDYEQQHVPIPDISGVELLKVLIAEFDLRQKDLVPIFKTEAIVSDILNGKRKLTVQHIKDLAQFFHISPAVFF